MKRRWEDEIVSCRMLLRCDSLRLWTGLVRAFTIPDPDVKKSLAVGLGQPPSTVLNVGSFTTE